MSLYPANDNAQDSLYPTDGNEVRNPMRTDLDGGGHKIFDLTELDLTGTGAITGVNTINGQPYPPYPAPLPTNRNQQFTFPTVQNVFGDGSQKPLFTIYDSANAVNRQLQPLFANTNISMVMLVLPVNMQQDSGSGTDQGLFDFFLLINGVQKAHSGQFIIPPRQESSIGNQSEANQIATLTFYLVRGVDYTGSLDVLSLTGAGAYNYNYYLNYNLIHSDQSQPTICNAVGFP